MGTVSETQAAILELLGEYRSLTTSQIRDYVLPGKDRQARRELARLRAAGLLASEALYPERGGVSELVWMLRKAGAAVIGVPYGSHYYRRPSRVIVQQRGFEIDLCVAVEEAGWSLIKPEHYGPQHPRPAQTPQAERLAAAILYRERQAIRQAAAQPIPPADLKERSARLMSGEAAWGVPRHCNDYVAHLPDSPGQVAVLVLHHPRAGKAFWTRPRAPGRGHPGRLVLYEPIVKLLPILAIFAGRDEAEGYRNVIEPAGVRGILLAQVTDYLAWLGRQKG